MRSSERSTLRGDPTAAHVAGLASVWVLWFMSILEINLELAAWLVLTYVIAYLVLASLGDQLKSPFAVTQAIRATTVTSILFLGALWHVVGGLDNPMFLVMFTLPVLIMLFSRRAPRPLAQGVLAAQAE